LCEDSPAYGVCNVDLFDLIQDDVFDFESQGSCFLIGEWNSRIGLRNELITCDMYNNVIDDDNYVSQASLDRNCNTFGIK
jgi:hypothetical protein